LFISDSESDRAGWERWHGDDKAGVWKKHPRRTSRPLGKEAEDSLSEFGLVAWNSVAFGKVKL